MLPTERAVWRHPSALQTLSHSFLEGMFLGGGSHRPLAQPLRANSTSHYDANSFPNCNLQLKVKIKPVLSLGGKTSKDHNFLKPPFRFIFFCNPPTPKFSHLCTQVHMRALACVRTHTRAHTHTSLVFAEFMAFLAEGCCFELGNALWCSKPTRCFWELKSDLDVPLQGTDHPCTANNPESCSVSLSPQDFINLFKFWITAHGNTSEGLPTDWMLGIQSLDTSFVNSVHFKHWLEASEISHGEDIGGERQSLAGNLRIWTSH